jgi:hypothetical protein
MTPQELCQIKSLEWHLSDWLVDLTYEDILDKLRNNDIEGLLIWQPLESLSTEDLAYSIERLTEQFLDTIWWRR